MVLPDDASAAEGASMFVNPLTALGFVETMRAEGHTAIVHLAAASNLGQMLNRLCLKDGIPLVNIVRSEAQATLLKDQGAKQVLDSTAPDYEASLAAAIEETGATIAFDPISGGRQAAQILSAMERAAGKQMTTHSRYGSNVFKQVYIYGVLDPVADGARPLGRLFVERRRVAAEQLPAEGRDGNRDAPAPAGGRRAQDHFREPIYGDHLARRCAEAGICAGLSSQGDGREISDRPEPLAAPRKWKRRPPRSGAPFPICGLTEA